jgi:general secretion pathway protein G
MKTNLRRRFRRAARRGMTLIEIIVVITIIALLTSAVAVAVIPRLEEAKRDRARGVDIPAIKQGLDTYYAKKGKYPDTGVGLKALVDAQIMDKVPTDPWEKEYIYLLENGKPVIMTYAKDGAPGGVDNDADISSKDAAGGQK